MGRERKKGGEEGEESEGGVRKNEGGKTKE